MSKIIESVDKYEKDREFPWEVVLSEAIPFIAELLSRRRALKQRVADLENIVRLQQHQIDEIKEIVKENGLI